MLSEVFLSVIKLCNHVGVGFWIILKIRILDNDSKIKDNSKYQALWSYSYGFEDISSVSTDRT